MPVKPADNRDGLRFGIILPCHGRLRRWQADAITRLRETARARPAFLICPRPAGNLSCSLTAALLPRARFEEFVDPPETLSGVAVIDDAAGGADTDHLASLSPDFFLCFDENEAWNLLASVAPHGLWRFMARERPQPPQSPLLEIALVCVRGQGSTPVPLRSGCISVTRHSWTATRQEALTEMSRWPALVSQDAQALTARNTTSASPGIAVGIRMPSRSTVPWHAARYLFERLFSQQTWAIGVADCPIETFLDSPGEPIQWLDGSCESYRYMADPFWIEDSSEGEGFSIICEEFDSTTLNQGRLVVAQVSAGRVVQTAALPQIGPGVHAAYPYLIRHAGELFCIPETAEAGGIDLYRRAGAPDRWTKVCRLLDLPGVDATPFFHEGRWWLATGRADDGPYHNLFLFYADSLTGPWKPHAANPVKCDVRSSRPAGMPFVRDGALYRPAQDCSQRYGGSIAINRVDELTPTRFSESVVAHVTPAPSGPFPHGLHTVCAAGRRTIVDGRRDFLDPFKQVRKQLLRRMIRRRPAPDPAGSWTRGEMDLASSGGGDTPRRDAAPASTALP